MEVDADPNNDDVYIAHPSPPRTPTNRAAQSLVNFLSPIQRELNRPGTSLTQRTAGILNSEVMFHIIIPYL